MKVNIITPVRPGGPYYSGENLARILQVRGIAATWTHDMTRILSSLIWQNADVVHSMSVPITYRFWRKPLVLTVKGEYTIEKNLWRSLFPLAIKKAEIVTTPSHFLKERLGLKDAIVIPNAIFPERFKQVKHIEKATLHLVTVTKFFFEDKARGILDILKVLDTIPEAIAKRIRYTVVGGGPYLNKVKSEARRYKVEVEFTDMLQNPVETLENSDIFLYYSHHDNFPNIILEAMACGLPVVTNSIGAVSEMIEDGKDGYITRTSEAYLESLLNLADSSDLRSKVGQNARRSIETKFDLSKVFDSYIEIYKKVL